MHYGWIKDEKNRTTDEVLLTVMRAPKTYTREDVVEISCHGGPVILGKILKLCVDNGSRLALPGEFTKRAFLNGRIDLSQAEAVISLIKAKSDNGLKAAASQLSGRIREELGEMRDELINILTPVEAAIDFPESGVFR